MVLSSCQPPCQVATSLRCIPDQIYPYPGQLVIYLLLILAIFLLLILVAGWTERNLLGKGIYLLCLHYIMSKKPLMIFRTYWVIFSKTVIRKINFHSKKVTGPSIFAKLPFINQPGMCKKTWLIILTKNCTFLNY